LWSRVVWQTFTNVSEVFAASIIRAIALMMEAASTSETLIIFYQTTRRYNPEDSHLHWDCSYSEYAIGYLTLTESK
jgi:hypothetical protein